MSYQLPYALLQEAEELLAKAAGKRRPRKDGEKLDKQALMQVGTGPQGLGLGFHPCWQAVAMPCCQSKPAASQAATSGPCFGGGRCSFHLA